VSISELPALEVDWLLQGIIPKGMLTCLIGDEGIGKGLYCCLLMAQVTTDSKPVNVLLVSGEDDPQRMVRPRLEAAGADLERVRVVFEDVKTQTGLLSLPEDVDDLRKLIFDNEAGLVVVDPWLSLASPQLQVKDTQQARRVLDPLGLLARETGASILLVGHTNRADSASARNRYGATVGIRQVVRHALMALPDPSEPDTVLVGVEKSTISAITPAVRYRRSGTGGSWRLERHELQTDLTVREIVAAEGEDRPRVDRRHSDMRRLVHELLAVNGQVTRQEVIGLYEEAGKSADAAEKALSRWSSGDQQMLFPLGQGIYLAAAQLTPPAPPVSGNGGKW
jgi:hypothetical protein